MDDSGQNTYLFNILIKSMRTRSTKDCSIAPQILSSKDQISTFSSILNILKKEGCILLIIGETSLQKHRYAAQYMLGEAEKHTRHRLFIHTQTDPYDINSDFHTYSGQAGNSIAAILNWTGCDRSIATQINSQHNIPEIRLPNQELDTLTHSISEAIAVIENQANTLQPAELRVWIDSLEPILDQSEEEIVKFLTFFENRIKNVNGMGIISLNVSIADPIFELLRSFFDAVIELKVEQHLHQRWRLQESELMTEWIPVKNNLSTEPSSEDSIYF